MSSDREPELNEIPYMKGNQLIRCDYSQTEQRYVMPKARGFWQTFTEWWDRKS